MLWIGACVGAVFGGVASLSEAMDHPIVRTLRVHEHETEYSSFFCVVGVFGFAKNPMVGGRVMFPQKNIVKKR